MPSTQEQLRKTLLQFYHNPVATVSFELLLSIGAVMFFALFAIRPTIVTMSDLLKEIQDKKELLSQLDRKVAALSTVQTEFLQVQDKLPLLDQALPNKPELIYTLKVIEKLASDDQLLISGVSVNEIPSETTGTPDLNTLKRVDLPITISIVGDYPTIRQFVESLQSYRRSFVVDTIVFTTSQEKGSPILTATITVYAPYYSNQAPVTKPAAAAAPAPAPATSTKKTTKGTQ